MWASEPPDRLGLRALLLVGLFVGLVARGGKLGVLVRVAGGLTTLHATAHGGRSPGAPRGKKNGNFKEGFFTCEAVNERKWVRDLIDTYAKETDK